MRIDAEEDMKHGFIKVAAVTPKIKVADPEYNASVCIEEIKKAAAKGCRIIVLPELVLTGYTCGQRRQRDNFYEKFMHKTAAVFSMFTQRCN